jgi:hypothetical protein
MGYFTTEDLPNILSVTKLRRLGLLKDSTLEKFTVIHLAAGLRVMVNEKHDPVTGDVFRVRYSYACLDGITRDFDFSIPLVSTACHYGGARWWFLCPCTGRRCAVLYLQVNGHFACRQAIGLIYPDQKATKRLRLFIRCLGRNFTKAIILQRSIKFWSWKGQPTRKVRRLMRLKERFTTMEDLERFRKSWR